MMAAQESKGVTMKTNEKEENDEIEVEKAKVGNNSLPEPVYHRKFGPRTRAMEVLKGVDLAGRTILITGTTTGIGVETARALVLHGAHVVMANRNVELSEQLRQRLLTELAASKDAAAAGDTVDGSSIDIIQMDLASLASVKRAAEEFLAKGWPLHVLILNAGVANPPVPISVNGYETTFAVNHLGHFYLTHLLLPKLKESGPGARLVVVSSYSHSMTGIRADWPLERKLEALTGGQPLPIDGESHGGGGGGRSVAHFLRNFRQLPKAMRLYSYSKLCNLLMALKIHNEEYGGGGSGSSSHHPTSPINIYVVHPGMIPTGAMRNFGPAPMIRTAQRVMRLFAKTLEQGAATTVYCAASPDVENDSGKYYENCWDDEVHLQKALAHDRQLQDALWERSMEMVQKFEAAEAASTAGNQSAQ